ncbi:MAG: lyase family protein, partial [Saprospiraceae bacterium]
MNNAIGPIDGRYSSKLQHLSTYFSENALFKYRIKVEILYFIQLVQKRVIKAKLTAAQIAKLHKVIEEFNDAEALKIRKSEKITKHDVKAVEYYVKEKLENIQLSKYSEFVHFGLTSQDVNNTAIPMLLKDASNKELVPMLEKLILELKNLSKQNRKQAMLARTHGQPASPTTLGKEIFVFVERLSLQLIKLKTFEYSGKFGGATGNFNAHKIAFPKVDWKNWS